MIYNDTLSEYQKLYNSCSVCIVLFAIALLIIIGISSACLYFYWYLKRSDTNVVIKIIKILDHVNIDSANLFYLVFNNVDGYFIEKGKYLIFASIDKNKEVLSISMW